MLILLEGLLYHCLVNCVFPYNFVLGWQILHLLGNEGPKTADPSKYIRYIYNRVILENATVRASAVSALAKFGVVVESLRPRILVLLRRCLYDNDDEVCEVSFVRLLFTCLLDLNFSILQSQLFTFEFPVVNQSQLSICGI